MMDHAPKVLYERLTQLSSTNNHGWRNLSRPREGISRSELAEKVVTSGARSIGCLVDRAVPLQTEGPRRWSSLGQAIQLV